MASSQCSFIPLMLAIISLESKKDIAHSNTFPLSMIRFFIPFRELFDDVLEKKRKQNNSTMIMSMPMSHSLALVTNDEGGYVTRRDDLLHMRIFHHHVVVVVWENKVIVYVM